MFAARDLAPGDEVTIDYRHLLGEGQAEAFRDARSGEDASSACPGRRACALDARARRVAAGLTRPADAPHAPARHEYRRMRWKNNLGWTREIHRHPDRDDYAWRVSIAEIDHDCAFSPFPGHDRVLVLLEGNGMQLEFHDGRSQRVEPAHGRVAFRGEDGLDCRLIDGPTRDFNLIWDRKQVQAELMHRPLVGPMLFFPEPAVTWLVYLIGGRARLKDRPDVAALDTGDSLLLQAGTGDDNRIILDGGGELLLARVTSLAR